MSLLCSLPQLLHTLMLLSCSTESTESQKISLSESLVNTTPSHTPESAGQQGFNEENTSETREVQAAQWIKVEQLLFYISLFHGGFSCFYCSGIGTTSEAEQQIIRVSYNLLLNILVITTGFLSLWEQQVSHSKLLVNKEYAISMPD